MICVYRGNLRRKRVDSYRDSLEPRQFGLSGLHQSRSLDSTGPLSCDNADYLLPILATSRRISSTWARFKLASVELAPVLSSCQRLSVSADEICSMSGRYSFDSMRRSFPVDTKPLTCYQTNSSARE